MSAHDRGATTPAALLHLERDLTTLRDQGLLRERPRPYAGPRPSFCSNDYLGLAATANGFAGPGGAGASRLVVGEHDAHLALEAELADWLEVPSTLTFASGYAANVGVLGALVSAADLVVSDALNHASLIDGCRLARAQTVVVPHLDLDAAARALRSRPRGQRAWLVTESTFSMDGDSPDLRALRALADDTGAALIVDEAHSLGVRGPDGRGALAEAGVQADILVGTLGKALGRQGAFVGGSPALIAWLWNRARSFVFSTGLSPALASSARWALRTVRSEPSRRDRCLANAARLRAGLGLPGASAIVPLVLGEPGRAVAAAAAALEEGIHVQAIRPPTVPEGASRLRVTATALQSSADVDEAIRVLGRFT